MQCFAHTNQKTMMSEEKNTQQEEHPQNPEVQENANEAVEASTAVDVALENETTKEATEEPKAEAVEQSIEKKEEKPAYVPEDRGPHDDFDWEAGNDYKLPYTEEEKENYTRAYSSMFTQVHQGEIVKGLVIGINKGNVVLNINYKSDGLVPINEFRDTPDLKPGDYVDVYVEQLEDEKGRLILSRKKAKLLKAWEALVDSYENGTIINGHIVNKTKGGLIVDCGGLETFLPGSQIDVKPIIDYDSYLGKTMEFKVVKINEVIKNAVVSHKALVESDLAEQREAIIKQLEIGQVLEGTVKNITDFGAFMDLGGVDGLLYITDISWGRISHPSDVLELNQVLNVVVLDFDQEKKRISLGLKQLQPHPWEMLGEEIKEGAVVKGKIVNIEDYGAFMEITPGVEGLIHVSEVTWSNQPINAREYFTLGQEVETKIVTIDREERKMSLSIKQLTQDPWADIDTRYPIGSRHTGEVMNLTPYGVFVELEEGIGGMIHISDLSWLKRFSHPSEFTRVGENIDVIVLDVDKDKRKMSLGHKQLEENPWDTFEKVFPVGSYHEATILKIEDRGAIVQLPYGLEAFAPINHIRKEDRSMAKVDESLPMKVIEFNRDDKRILVSHQRYLEDINKEAGIESQGRRGEERRSSKPKKKAPQVALPKIEKTTLGELDAFEDLKKQLENQQEAEVKAAKDEQKQAEAKKETPKQEAKKEETAVQAEAEKPEASKAKASGAKKDDLKKIEGIGPKISQLLMAAGIHTFEDLSKAEVEKLNEILAEAGSRYRMHDPTTWPEQAALAAAGKWDELQVLQDELKGGKKAK